MNNWSQTLENRGIVGWISGRIRGLKRATPHLTLVERIALAPRQSLALVQADGRRFLVATSAEGTPAFYPLDERPEASWAAGNAAANARLIW